MEACRTLSRLQTCIRRGVNWERRQIWDYAGLNGFVLTTTDADFFDLASNLGPPPKVVWLRRWSHPTRDVEELLRREAVRITGFATDLDLGILILEKHGRRRIQ